MPKKQISTNQQSVFIETNVPSVFSKKRYSEATSDRVSDPVSDDRTCSGRGYDDRDIDLIGGGGQKSSSNKDRFSGKRHAGAFQRNNNGNDPRAMDLDQTNQRTRERSKVHFRPSKSLALCDRTASEKWDKVDLALRSRPKSGMDHSRRFRPFAGCLLLP